MYVWVGNSFTASGSRDTLASQTRAAAGPLRLLYFCTSLSFLCVLFCACFFICLVFLIYLAVDVCRKLNRTNLMELACSLCFDDRQNSVGEVMLG